MVIVMRLFTVVFYMDIYVAQVYSLLCF